jgi:hypothetical protein
MQEYFILIVVAAEIAYFHIDFDAVGRKYTNVFITSISVSTIIQIF